MPKITKEQAREFLDNISSKDRVAIIHHDDLDGFASGILLYDFCKMRGTKVKSFPSELEEGMFTELLKELKEYDKILITDIAPHFISNYLELLKSKEILYIDHHQKDTEISNFILEYRAPKDKYFPASRIVYELTEKENQKKEWLAIGGTITDVGYKYPENNEFINSFLEKNNISLEDYQAKVTHPITAFLIYFSENLSKAFKILKKIKNWKELEEVNNYAEKVEKEIQNVLEEFKENKKILGKINFYYFKPKFKIKSIIATNLGLAYLEDIIIIATPSQNNPNKLDISGRCQSRDISVPELLKDATKNLENTSVGGHLRAAGGFIQAKDLEKFKENLRKFSEKNNP